MPSLQLARYLQLRADGVSVEAAAEQSGIGQVEAELHEQSIAAGELELPCARAPARKDEQSGEGNMAQQTVAADELRLLIERIERLKEEIKGLNDDVSDVFKEAKSRGFDTWAMKEVLKWRRLETHTRNERATILELYMSAVGLTPVEAEILKAA